MAAISASVVSTSELAELHRTIHGRTVERDVVSGEMYRNAKKQLFYDCHKTINLNVFKNSTSVGFGVCT